MNVSNFDRTKSKDLQAVVPNNPDDSDDRTTIQLIQIAFPRLFVFMLLQLKLMNAILQVMMRMIGSRLSQELEGPRIKKRKKRTENFSG